VSMRMMFFMDMIVFVFAGIQDRVACIIIVASAVITHDRFVFYPAKIVK